MAEQFGNLDALFPVRVDLGLGWAPGTDPLTSHAPRRYEGSADRLPDDGVELRGYVDGSLARWRPTRERTA